jgi:hypothetical protein
MILILEKNQIHHPIYETTAANILKPKEMTVINFGASHLRIKFTK